MKTKPELYIDEVQLLKEQLSEAQGTVERLESQMLSETEVLPGRTVFNWPVGEAEERATVWPGKWVDATGYATRYEIKPGVFHIHTGCDFNLNAPKFDLDAHQPVYAAAAGLVVFAGIGTGTWGNLVVIRHAMEDGRVAYTRYAHLESYSVAKVQSVGLGQEIGRIGNAGGKVPYHLHFDVAIENLEARPSHWPGTSIELVRSGYLNPKTFIPGRLK